MSHKWIHCNFAPPQADEVRAIVGVCREDNPSEEQPYDNEDCEGFTVEPESDRSIAGWNGLPYAATRSEDDDE